MIRRTPLRSDPAKVREWQDRSRRALPTVGRRGRREAAAVAVFRRDVRANAAGRCQVATPACQSGPHRGDHSHHVYPSDRDAGVHDPTRGLYVCWAGHRWIHDHPDAAIAAGWLGRSSS